jgi:uncharacterized membrane protein
MMPAVSLPAPSVSVPPLDANPPTSAPPHAFIRGTRAVAVAALLGLIALGLAWELWLAPTGSRWLAFKVLPLLWPLAGLLKHRLYTYRWVSLLVWLYFTEGIVRATGVPSGADAGLDVWLAWIEVALCLVLFTACAAHVRWRLKHPSPHTA